MVERHDRAGMIWAALAGTAWGVGLARFLAEFSFISVLHTSPWVVLGVVAMCGAAAALAYRLSAFSPLVLLPLVVPTLYAFGVAKGALAGGVLLSGSLVVVLGLAGSRLRRFGFPSFLVFLVSILYLRTLLPSIGQADTLEFQVVAPLLRVAHPTGYPLYILVTHLFSWLPIGGVAFRVNLASAAYATGAVLTLYYLLTRLTESRWTALLASLAFGVSGVFWSQAIVAEVYSLHNLLVALALFLLLGRQNDPRRWPFVCLLLGASLANHLTTALVLPAVVLSMAWERPRLPLRTWVFMSVLFVLGLSLYLYIPLRWPAVNSGEQMTLEQFINHVTAQQFQGALQWDGWRDPVRWSIVGRLLVSSYGWPGLVLAGAGVADWLIKRRGLLVITGVTFAAFVLYGLNYHVPDISVFLIPASLVMALWMGAGIAALVEWAQRLRCQASGRTVILTLASLLPLGLIWINLPVVDQSRETGSETWGRRVLDLPLEAQSVVLADVERFAPLHYLTDVERIRSDLDIVILGEESLYRLEIEERLAAGQTVYLARYLSHLERYSLRSVGPLVQVSPMPVSQAASPEVAVGVLFGEGVRLLGYDIDSVDGLPQEPLRLTLYWQAEGSVPGDYVVRLRLVDGDDRVRWQSEESRPVSGLYPTNAWRPGEMVTDYYEMTVPPHLWSGEYRVQVGLFAPFADEGLVSVDGQSWVSLLSNSVGEGEPPPLANQIRASLGDQLWLTGYEMPGEVPAGGILPVTLEWRREADMSRAFLHFAWLDEAGQVFVARQGIWLEDTSPSTFHTRSILTAPTSAGDYSLLVGWGTNASGQALPARCAWLARSGYSCPVAVVTISPEQEGLAGFDGKVLLVSAEIEAEQLGPGSVLPVLLHWRALANMDKDYTVTVQLLGPDGRLHGQVDAWPVEGTFPTSQWDVGQEIDDRYMVAVEADAPAGQYQVMVGWYLLETMERLPVLDDAGTPVADHVVIGELELAFP